MLSKTTLRYGALTGLVLGVWLLLEFYLGFRTTNFGVHLWTNLIVNPLIFLTGIVLTFRAVQKTTKISFLTGLKITLLFGLVSGAAWALLNLFYLTVVDPEYIERIQSFVHYISGLENHNWYQLEAEFKQNAWQYSLGFRSTLPLLTAMIVSTIFGLPLSIYYQLANKSK